MEFRIRHMALFLYSGISALAITLKPELITSLMDLMLLTAPIAGMFAWDKLKSGTVIKANK